MNELNNNDYDLDLDLHAIWHESSGIPTPPPCLATDPNDLWQDFLGKVDPARCETPGSSLIECLFYPNIDSLSGFKWTGPDPLSTSTQASDIFLHMSALLFPKDVHWIEFRFVQFDRTSGETIGEDLFFLPRVETALGNLCRVRRQLLDTITSMLLVQQALASDCPFGLVWNLYLIRVSRHILSWLRCPRRYPWIHGFCA
ncbi:unnamed protein product [Penicillium salamii]|uniref:Uncharacterized protein n=1 Tax=Penicillium salamii TaxID=1612424 RepID=A0A9W4IIZ3_9EURO|nr:unnamed protein product [Penicillium salamii]CAG7977807.1 unnamed protein product [Penicillium salamii]CAG8030462.1 unnamed protein product [Penicillium salamii]CAG8294012.1 unnamed protein product [Penicillium salamii]CAG8300263.1 unnamed protein product [Penicillium salamii]